MSSLEGGFDPVGVVIDWLDACCQRRLTDLLELYADQATLDCCGGGRFVGRTGMFRYWSGKLDKATAAAFRLYEVQPEGDCVRLNYSDYDGSAGRTKFWFDDSGNITGTLCVPFGKDGTQAEVA